MFKKNTSIGFDFKWDRLEDSNHFKQAMLFTYNATRELPSTVDLIVINGLLVCFNKNRKVIGLTFSGGADSTMLLYLLCRIITEFNLGTKIVVATTIRFWENKIGTDYVATKVMEYMKNLFPSIELVHEFGFIPTALETTPLKNISDLPEGYFTDDEMNSGHADLYASYAWNRYLANKYEIPFFYNGVTMNPAHLGEEVNAPQHRTIKDSADFTWTLQRNFTSPFKLINKDWVMAQYINFGLDALARMTKSCNTGEQEIVKKFGTKITGNDMQKYACAECFFCHERTWAENNLTPYLETTHK
jgi:3'-phosphoadenosine 5'-phosphosulfate sulfotransferase (PAPS reductase)/FAD synthetase